MTASLKTFVLKGSMWRVHIFYIMGANAFWKAICLNLTLLEYVGKYISGTFLERSQGCVRWKNIFQDQSSTTSNTQTAPSTTSITPARAGQQNRILHHSVNLSVLNFLLFDKLYKTPGMRPLIESFSEKPLKLELFLPWPKKQRRWDFMKNWDALPHQ